VLAVSLDGRLAPPAGGAAQIGGSGDRRVLEEALAWADAALLGAETLRRHGTTCLIRQPDLLEQRHALGRGDQPLALVVSRSGQLPATLPFWQQPLRRWWLQPAQAAAPGCPSAPVVEPVLPGLERHLRYADLDDLLAQLGAAGLQRLVLLGGAALAGAFLEADRVDELQLTLCPLLLGGIHSWCPAALTLTPNRWRLLEQRPLPGEELMLRYGRLAPSR
jgi:5-amino-6-(5-phosphoribosylamino)uracil reductase